ncbi:MAG TPA: ABC transporter substrate-binding protein [Fimbriimonas sp.]|nr:ABC transporter substrate-binding protein [Fimbriimonas sp.]
MSTKVWIGLLFLFCVVLGVGRSDLSCAGPSGRHKLQINFWNGFTGPDGQIMLGIIRKFNEANPDVEVTMQRMDWDTYYNKLMVAELDGRGPEVFVIQSQWMARMNRAGFVADVSDLFTGSNPIPKDDFDPVVISQVQYGQKMVGVPLDIWPFGLYMNADYMKEIGFTDANGNARAPKDKAEFLKAITELKKTAPDGSADRWGFALDNWRWDFQSLLPQFNGRYFDEKGRADLANPNNVAALQFLVSLNGPPRLMPPPENAMGWVGFRQKKVAMVVDGIFMVGDLKRLNDFNYVGAPVPVIGSRPGTLADSHCLCVRHDLSPEMHKAAERFIKFLSNNSIDWADAGQVPARKSVRADPRFAQMPVQYAFSKEIPYIQYLPRTPVLFDINRELDFAVESAIRGRMSSQDALKQASDHVQEELDRDALEQKEEGLAK